MTPEAATAASNHTHHEAGFANQAIAATLWNICKATTMRFDTLYCMQYDPELRVAAKLLPELSSLTDNDTSRQQLLQATIRIMKQASQIKL